MESLNNYQWPLYLVTCAVVAFALLMQCIPYVPLYRDPELRSRVGTIVQATAIREGWITSGLSIRHIDNTTVELLYRSHLRGKDPLQCVVLYLDTGRLSSCDS